MTAHAIVREPHDGEWREIADLLRVCFADEGPEIGGIAPTAELVEEFQRSGDHLLVAEVRKRIVGFVRLAVSGRARASQLAVDPKCRRMGYGKRLMEEVEAEAKTLGREELRLAVMGTKESLVAYYERLGYTRTGERGKMETVPGYSGPKHEVTILSKKLR